ncbi:transporter substrate-binding domain-containing protein [Desulfobotulus sp. H1]|uniref:Transporter substrate-binding domain-containing protein n=1 Tax=Desulfobotulus pelophilus TaxID=2823377 RepID=A0ABT3N6S3_9BACT|nr:transporter substrate-binding domain-containing protein [Desulfobotulus pelophilus]MCW7753148.1 transporter substrate-binding domain-containing protein [Desulfobotulus pelophilus]
MKQNKAPIIVLLLSLVLCLTIGGGIWFYMSLDRNLSKGVAKDSTTLVIANGEWIPYQGETLREGGPMTRIVTEAFKRQGWEVEYLYLPWAQGLSMTEKVNADATMLYSYNEQRGTKFFYSDPVLQLDTVVFYNLNKPLQWENPADLKGLTLGGVEKYDYGFVREEDGYRIRRSASSESNHRRLADGRLDGTMDEVLVGMKILRENNLQHRISFHPTPIKRTDYHLIVSKEHPRATIILETFNKGLASLKEDGTFKAFLHYE